MNYVWCAMILGSLVCAVFTGRIEETANAAMEGARASVNVILSFGGVMCMWMGFMRLAEHGGLVRAAGKILSPLVGRLFPNASEKAKDLITMNISTNLLGMGNAATPPGINAMKELDKSNVLPDVPSKAMCRLIVMNTSSLQIIPSTVIALRASAGAASPGDITVPVWIASAAGLTVSLLAVKIFIKDKAPPDV